MARSRFTNRDTVFGMLKTPITLNRYTYANGDPLQYFDPDGRRSLNVMTPTDVGGGAITSTTSASEQAAKSTAATGQRTKSRDDLENRYTRNREAIKSRIAKLERDLRGRVSRNKRRAIRKEIGFLRPLASEDRQIYHFGRNKNDYEIIEVNGDLLEADNIGVVVSGTNQGLHNFDKDVGAKARFLKDAAGGSTATVAWLGYDAPKNAAQGFNLRPVEGGRRLAGFVNSNGRDNPKARMTVIGHSYGSAVVGEAMRNGLRADNTVHTGSPGLGLGAGARSAENTGFGGRVYAAQAAGDHTVTKTVPICSSYPPYCAQVDPHGPAPLDLSGVRRLDATGSRGHNEYYVRTSLDSIASVVTGTVREQGSGLWGAG